VVGLDAHATQVVTGFRHACALLVTGAVRCWGSNEIGQIGDGSQVDRSVPTPVSALPDDVIALSSSSTAEHTCALTSSGAVFCWGRSTAGMIGDGRLADPVATPVSGLPSGIRSVAVGEWNTCVVTTDRVSCWGSASQGALQQEPWRTGSDARRPQRLPYLPTDVAQVSVGGSTICALTLTGDLSCWGNNAHGELGAGLRPMTYRLRPQEVAGAWLAPV
jgi:alpha-tubulin suppressor-like RCC1 family protein